MNKFLVCILVILMPVLMKAQDIKKVLIIGIDGCRSDALLQAFTPSIDRLIDSGIYSPDALNDDITISGPGWSAILCGVWSDKHLVTGNDFTVDNYDRYPSLFKRVEEENPELHTVSICHWAPINDIIIREQADFRLNVSSDEEVARQASDYIRVNDPDLVFLHFDDADMAGHRWGFSPNVPEYRSAIERIDSLIDVVINAIDNRPTGNDEDWMILLTTDHGGLGTSHGGNSIDEERVFVIASTDSVTPEIIVRDSMTTRIEVINCLGDSTELTFDGGDDRVEVPSATAFDFGADVDFSIECRVRTSASGDVAIIGNKDWQSGLNEGFVISFKYPAGPEWKVNIGDGDRRADINTGGGIADNQWHTLSVTFDRDGFMKMYQDGVFIDSTDISFIGNINTGSGLFFGTDINSDFDYEGSIAEVRVWNTVLDGESIKEWHCQRLTDAHPRFSSLLGYWKLNEGSGNSAAIDYSGNDNTGVITDAIWRQPDTVSTTYDYNSTPRLTDVFPTVLNHLCIPIDDLWDLDGSSLIESCEITSVQYDHETYEARLFPNPARDELIVELSDGVTTKDLRLEIYDAKGYMVYADDINERSFIIGLSGTSHGVFSLRILKNGRTIYTDRFIVH